MGQIVVSQGSGPITNSINSGDEAFLIAQKVPEAIVIAYKKKSFLINKIVTINKFQGKVINFSSSGGIILKDNQKNTKIFYNGQVQIAKD